jgi:hypothetical protein
MSAIDRGSPEALVRSLCHVHIKAVLRDLHDEAEGPVAIKEGVPDVTSLTECNGHASTPKVAVYRVPFCRPPGAFLD